MSAVNKSDAIFNFKDEKDRKELFKIQYNESAKVIDFCKNQQWYATTLAVGINYGLIVISQTYLKIIPCFALLVLLIMILITILISVNGCSLIWKLESSAKKHRHIVKELKSDKYLLSIPENLEEMHDYSKRYTLFDTNYVLMFNSAIITSSGISFIILVSKLISLNLLGCW